MRVSELSGALLDYWVARSAGFPVYECGTESWPGNDKAYVEGFRRQIITVGLLGIAAGVFVEYKGEARPYSPSSDWAQGGPIIERERIKLMPTIPTAATWYSSIWNGTTLADGVSHRAQADAPLVAAMRAYVASKYGDEVPDDPAQ